MLAGSFLDVLSRFIRVFSYVAIVFLVAGLIGLLTDEVRDTSKVQATVIVDPGTAATATQEIDIEQPAPSLAIERLRQQEHTGGREFIDDVGDVLMSPFTFLIKGSDGAVRHLLYAALALLLYGFLLQVLADFIRRQSDGSRRASRSAKDQADAEERRKSGQYASPA
jgi:hypothetical protein